jgi:hypothetical protein
MVSLQTILIFSMNNGKTNILFIVFAILSGAAAIYHFTGIFYKLNSSPVWRHVVFIFINIISIYGLLKRPQWFTQFFFVLMVQQLYSHGRDLLWHWNHEHRIDWISSAVLIFMPVVFIFLLLEKRKVLIS